MSFIGFLSISIIMVHTSFRIPYSGKLWRALNLAKWLKRLGFNIGEIYVLRIAINNSTKMKGKSKCMYKDNGVTSTKYYVSSSHNVSGHFIIQTDYPVILLGDALPHCENIVSHVQCCEAKYL